MDFNKEQSELVINRTNLRLPVSVWDVNLPYEIAMKYTDELIKYEK